MKSQHVVRSIAFATAFVLLVGCHGKKSETIVREMGPISKETTQLGPPLVSVETHCGDVSVQIGKKLAAASATPTPVPTGGAPMANVWQSATPTPGFPDNIDPRCEDAVKKYLLLAKSLQGDPKPAPWPGMAPIPGPNLWSTNPNYRNMAMMALGAAMARNNPALGPQVAMYAQNNPGAFGAITSQFGVSGNEVTGLLNGGSFGLNTPPPQNLPTPAPGFGLGRPQEQLTYASPQSVALGEDLNAYRARYGADWFRQRAARKGN